MAHVYILLTNRKTYYVGSTDDLSSRLSEHQKGWVKATKPWLHVTLVYWEEFQTRGEAQRKEYRIKRWKSKKLIESLIRKTATMVPSSRHPDVVGSRDADRSVGI